ncbi:nitrate ABC transporter substrate-binding protein [Clostridia bacterium]|nr:nitrate ABC transporter substrate-binding protein [Clostridia bacterium]
MKKATRRLLILAMSVAMALSAFAFTACKKDDYDIVIQLKWLPDAQFMGYFTAQSKGYYDEVGLKVKIVPGGGDVSETQAVINGSVDIGVTWVSNLIAANAGGANLVLVSQIFQRSGLYLVSRKGENGLPAEGITAENYQTALTDTVKVGNWGYGNEYEVLALLKKAASRTDMTYIGQDFTMHCFEVGTSDAAYCDLASGMSYNEYLLTIKDYEGTVNHNLGVPGKYNTDNIAVLDMNDVGVAMLEDCLFVSQTWLDKSGNEEKLTKFLQASLKGWTYAANHPSEAVGHITEGGDTNLPEHQTSMTPEVAKLVKYTPAVSSAAIKAGTATAIDDKLIGVVDTRAGGAVEQTLQLAKDNFALTGTDASRLAAMKVSDLVKTKYWEDAVKALYGSVPSVSELPALA